MSPSPVDNPELIQVADPGAINLAHYVNDIIDRASLASSGGAPNETTEQVCIMPCRADLEKRSVTNSASGGNQELNKNRCRVSFGLRLNDPRNAPADTVKGIRIKDR